MARPTNKQPTRTCEIAVPRKLYEYLGFLAKHTHLGASESTVAIYLLTKQIDQLVETKFHEINIPGEREEDQ